MKVQFVGVGEAFDESLPNNSQLLEWDGCRLLIDCGYAVPHALWRLYPDANYIDAVYISHRHADHYFGLPSYLLRLDEDGRRRPLVILCPEKQVILEMIDYAYQGVLAKLAFEADIREVSTERPVEFQNSRMEFAVSSHPVKNFAVAVHAENKKYAYSGDGNFNKHTRQLYTGCSLLVHEAYALDQDVPGHARIGEVLQMAREQGVRKLALTHLQRDVRRKKRFEIEALIRDSGLEVLIPEPGDIHEM